MKDPKYELFLESFVEHAKKQDATLVDGSVMVFIPAGGSASDASIFSWISDATEKMQSEIWHDSFVAMLFALISNGVDGDVLHEMVDYAMKESGSISAETYHPTDGEYIN